MQSLGEMTTWLPLPGAVPQLCARYVDEAMGFAVGWNVSSSMRNTFFVLNSGHTDCWCFTGMVLVNYCSVC